MSGWGALPGLKRIGAVLVLAVFCVPLFVDLGREELRGDEPIYAFAVDLILETGDWLTPRSIPYENAPFLEKPPLKFWIVAASMRAGLLPHDDFGQRFWDAAFGAFTFLYVFAIGLRLAGPFCGLAAVFVLFVHQPLLFEHGLRSQNMEAALVLSYCGAMFHALAWSSSDSRTARRMHPFAVGGYFVLGFMVKFVAAIFLPFVLFLMPLLFPAWRARFRRDWRTWAAVSLVVLLTIAPWFIYQSFENANEFWDVILGVHVYERMTGFLDPAHLHPWHYYFSTIRFEFGRDHTLAPVICGLLTLIVVTTRRRWDAGMLVLLWLIVPLVAISFGSSKLYHYAYPFLPPLALSAGYLPGMIVRRDSMLSRTLEQWGSSLSARVSVAQAPWVRTATSTLAVIAFVVAVATLVYGRFSFGLGDVVLFRNSSVARPLLVGLALLIVSSHGWLAGRLVLPLVVLVLLPLDSYRDVLRRLDDGKAPTRSLAQCLQDLTPADQQRGVYVQAEDLGQWKFVYYFRRIGVQQPSERPFEALTPKLFVPEQQQPVIVSDDDYSYLRRLFATEASFVDIASVRLDSGLMLLLPGRYASCVLPQAELR